MSVRASISASIIAALPLSATADPTIFDINVLPLPAALRAFSEQAQMQVLYQYELVRGRTGHAAHGNLEKHEALSLILRDTGLEAVFTSQTAVAIRPIAVGTRVDNGNASSPAMSVEPSTCGHAESAACGGKSSSAGLPPPEIEEIIVTARRREESLSKTPVAVTALTGTQLQAAGVTSVVQLQYVVPGLSVSRDRQGVNLSIRGVTTTDTTTKGEPGINFNTDGIPVNRSEEQALGFFDVQRVEVLSGPQGTLYGKSSTGGAINVVTNAPSEAFEARLAAELGNFSATRLDAMINVPLNESFAVRAAVNANYRDGYAELRGGHGDAPNDEANVAVRVSGLARFNDDFKFRLTATLGGIDGIGYGNDGLSLNTDDDYTGQGSAHGFANRFSAHVRDEFTKVNAQMDAPLRSAQLTYLGSYSRYRTDNLMPNYGYQTNGQRLWVRDTYDTTYQELRLTNADWSRLQYVAGINYFYEHIDENGHLWALGPTEVAALGIDPDYYNALNLINDTTHTTYSAYFQANYAWTPRWRMTVGAREASDKTMRSGTIASGPFSAIGADGPIPWLNASGTVCTGTDDCLGVPNNGSGESKKFTYTLGSDYRFTADQMGYLTIATGYKAGGFNDVDPVTHGASEYGPENITAYEAGYKLRKPSGLQFSSSVYYYDYSREQISQLLELNGDPTNRVLYTRVVPTTIYGWENSLSYPVARNDLLEISTSLASSHYDDSAAGPTFNVDFSGKSLDRIPSVVVNLGYAHRWALAGGATLQWHAALRYSSSYYVTDLWAARQYKQEPFTHSSLDLLFTSRDGRYTTQLFVRNLENKVQITGGAQGYVPATPYSAAGSVSEPRFWGLRQAAKF